MTNLKLRAWDHFNDYLVCSDEPEAEFTLRNGKWSVKYVREKTLYINDIEIDAPVEFQSDEVEVMLFTGKQDKNRKDIYEGDKIKVGSRVYVVEYSETLFRFHLRNHLVFIALSTWVSDEIEVIGNIYEDQNLLTHA